MPVERITRILTVEKHFVGGTGPAGADGTDGAAGPNTVSGSTTTTLTGYLKGNGSVISAESAATVKTALSLVKGDVGLGNVDNTSDANKPVSTATQTALDLKAPLASPTFTGTVTVPDASFANAKLANMATKTYKGRTAAGTGVSEDVAVATLKTDLGLVKGDVGLGNVDNTNDANKPVSTATQTALDAKQGLDSDLTTIAGLTATTDNFMVAAASAWASRTPAQAKTSLALVKADVGLGNVDNTSDVNKPISTATQTALDAKQVTLVSATNIKTINGSSVLGSGDLTVSGAAQDISTSKMRPTGDESIAADTGVAIPRSYLIASGKKMLVNSGGRMRIL